MAVRTGIVTAARWHLIQLERRSGQQGEETLSRYDLDAGGAINGCSAHTAGPACMDEQSALLPDSTEQREIPYMLGFDDVAIAFRLNQPALTGDNDLPVNAAIAGVSAIADDPVPAPLEGLEQQFLERQRVHRAKPCIMQRGGLVAIASA